jgi:hypothetical protein
MVNMMVFNRMGRFMMGNIFHRMFDNWFETVLNHGLGNRSVIRGLRSVIRGLRSVIRGLRSVIRGLRSVIGGLRRVISGLRSVI